MIYFITIFCFDMKTIQENCYMNITKTFEHILENNLVFSQKISYKNHPIILKIILKEDGFHLSTWKIYDYRYELVPNSACIVATDKSDELIRKIKEHASKYAKTYALSHIVVVEEIKTTNILSTEMKDKINNELKEGFDIQYITDSIKMTPDFEVTLVSNQSKEFINAVKITVEGICYYFSLSLSDFECHQIFVDVLQNGFNESAKPILSDFLQKFQLNLLEMCFDRVEFAYGSKLKEFIYSSDRNADKQCEVEKKFISLLAGVHDAEKNIIMTIMYFYKKTPAFTACVQNVVTSENTEHYIFLQNIYKCENPQFEMFKDITKEDIINILSMPNHKNFQLDLYWYLLVKTSLSELISEFIPLFDSLKNHTTDSTTNPAGNLFTACKIKPKEEEFLETVKSELDDATVSTVESPVLSKKHKEKDGSLIKEITESETYKYYSMMSMLKDRVLLFAEIYRHNMLSILSEMFGLGYLPEEFKNIYDTVYLDKYIKNFKTNESSEVINARRSCLLKVKPVEDVLNTSDIYDLQMQNLYSVAKYYDCAPKSTSVENPAVTA